VIVIDWILDLGAADDARRGAWPDYPCTRCVGFELGHSLSVRHGAYSNLKLTARAGEIVDELRELVTRYRPSDELLVCLLAVTWTRVEAAAETLENSDDPEKLSRLEHDLRAWVNTTRRRAAASSQLTMSLRPRD
jgi:hypothetical protein